MSQTVYDFEVNTIAGEPGTLRVHEGKVLLIVNTASACGLTPQFAGLETLYNKYREQGFEVLGFPCNQFGGLVPGSYEEIAGFCQKNYGVSFPMHARIEVNGSGAHPLYKMMKGEAPGLLGTEAIKWNFTKFLIARDGSVQKRFAPKTLPVDIESAISPLL